MDTLHDYFSTAKRIVVFTGAGISRAQPANLPTYEELGLTFSREMVDAAAPRWVVFKAQAAAAEPNAAHHFCALLHAQGRLHRVYTQNVDGLHERVLPLDKVVAVHGRAADDSIVCMEDNPFDTNPGLKARLLADFDCYNRDKHPDLCLVIGTRLNVSPFNWFPNLVVPHWCPRFFINPDLTCLPGVKGPMPYANGFGGDMGGGTENLNGRKVNTSVEWVRKNSKYGHHQWLLEMTAEDFCAEVLTPEMPEDDSADRQDLPEKDEDERIEEALANLLADGKTRLVSFIESDDGDYW
jgi:NAD-dependent SIR2 family protein deacetylase